MTHPTDPLREAAQAVLDRWDSRNWKAAPTADYMRRLRAALAAAPQPAAEDRGARAIAEAAQITMTYRNWRGEVAQRTIRPVALWFGKTDWHPEPGWLLSAWDCDKGERRDFALADCQFADLARPSHAGYHKTALAAAPQPAPVDREDVERLATELERQDEYAPLGHVGWEAATTLRALLNRAEAAEAEALEQARLNGMGAERELALMGEIERLRKRLPV